MRYEFICPRQHVTEVYLTFTQHDELPRNENGQKFTECSVKYGEEGNPRCTERAVQDLLTSRHMKVI